MTIGTSRVLTLAALLGAGAACSSKPPLSFVDVDGGAHDGGHVTNPATIDSGTDPGGEGEDAGGTVTPPADAAQNPGLTTDSACAVRMSGTTRKPIDLMIVLDRSGSMNDDGSGATGHGGTSKWSVATMALETLVTALDDGASVGLILFPVHQGAASDVAADYTTALVPVAPLASNRTRILDLLRSGNASGDTPMACAVPGAIHILDAISDGSARNVLLTTDGQPTTECSGVTCANPFDLNCDFMATHQAQTIISANVSRASRETSPIKTFVIGLFGSDDNFLSQVALNGGTGRSPTCSTDSTCHYRADGADFQTQINAALDDIRGRAASCDFQINDIDPTMVDQGLVNVNYTPGAGMSAQTIPMDASHANGWDYSADQRSITLYGPICATVQANHERGAEVQILFGCPTIIPG